jgi:lysophospholipase L1-like esterase
VISLFRTCVALGLGLGLGLALGCRRTAQPDGALPGPREAAPGRSSASPAEPASSEPQEGDPAASAAEGPAWEARDVDAGRAGTARHVYRIVAVGDSLTDETAIGGRYLEVVRRRCPKSEVANFAKGGAMVNQIRRRFETEVLTHNPGTYTHLVVFGGVNDLYSDQTAGRTVEKVSADLTAIYSAARGAGMKVVAITVAPWGGFKKYFNAKRAADTVRLNDWIRGQRAAGAVDVVVDAATLLACGDNARLCPSFELSHPDGLHFNRAGHDRLGAALVEAAFADCK